jgi:hypothetical protein
MKANWQYKPTDYTDGMEHIRHDKDCAPDGYLTLGQIQQRFNSRASSVISGILLREKCPHIQVSNMRYWEEKSAVAIMRRPWKRKKR